MADLQSVIDLHVHAGPDVRPRKMTAVELAQAAEAAGMRGFLLKNHHTSTVLQAAAIREQGPGIRVYGGLVLNRAVGGFNPAAVEAAIRMGAKQIWMPTQSAENECAREGHPGSGLCIFDDKGALRSEVEEIIRLVTEAGIALGTGHLSPREIAALARAAQEVGLGKFIITHPEIRCVNLTAAMQCELARPGVYFERCFARRPLFMLTWEELARVIREVGYRSTVLATDLGQPENPDPVSGMGRMLDEMARLGFTRTELRTMSCHNPAALLGLE